jgi:hypothetical protein
MAKAMGLTSRLGGVVVSVLATVPKGRGFEPGHGDGFLRAIKILSTPSFGWEVKPEVLGIRFYGMLKITLSPTGTDTLNSHLSSPILLLAPEMSQLTGPPESRPTGGCQSALVDELGVSSSRYDHTIVHIAITRE